MYIDYIYGRRDVEFDVLTEPCPTLMAGGMAGNSIWHIYLYDDGSEVEMVEGTKPKYEVPTMEEVGALGNAGLKVVSTFSGAGGSCLGFKMAGYDVVWANEFFGPAADAYRANAPDTILDTRSIRDVQVEEVLEATGLKVGELDLFEGSPPCDSFSTAGKREKYWGKEKEYCGNKLKQRTDDLFFEYARLLRGLQPRAFVAENVSGLVKGAAKGYFKLILRELQGCGYKVAAKVLDAQWLGVPQMRKRVIFVGVRDDVGKAPAFPRPMKYYYSIADACSWIVGVERDPRKVEPFGGKIEREKPAPTITIHQRHGDWRNDVVLVKADPKKPTPTICHIHGQRGVASVVHPYEKRKFTIAELKRLSGFPDDFELRGTYADQWGRLGMSVPPVMMFHVARVVRDEVLLDGPWQGDPEKLTRGLSWEP